MRIQILSIEIPPTLGCNPHPVTINTNQIKDSRVQITAVGNRGQVQFQFKIDLLPLQKPDVDCLMALPNPIDCEALLSEVVIYNVPKVKGQLSFNGTFYILNIVI